MVKFMKNVRGKFGCTEEKTWPCTFGMNAKGGMDDCEFEKYNLGSIIPLYPDAKDVPGLRVMIKADSGPGRTAASLLTKLRMLGFILYPGVPNTTSVTQETDRNYGPFKTQFRQNLERVVQRRIVMGLSTSLQPWLVGLFVFGGEDPVSKLVLTEKECAFEVAFNTEANLRAWQKIGAAPCTRLCLSDRKVRRQLGDAKDSMNELMASIQEANTSAVALLTRRGYYGDFLAATVNPLIKRKAITVPHSKERLLAMDAAKTHGEKFHATGGGHLTSDCFFKSLEVPEWKRQIAALKDDKEVRTGKAELQLKAEALLVETGGGTGNLRVPQLDLLLKWHAVPLKDIGNKPQKMQKWKEILEAKREPPPFESWTAADKSKITELEKFKLEVEDTALGRQRLVRKRELFALVASMAPEELEGLKREMDLVGAEVVDSLPVDLPTLPEPSLNQLDSN